MIINTQLAIKLIKTLRLNAHEAGSADVLQPPPLYLWAVMNMHYDFH